MSRRLDHRRAVRGPVRDTAADQPAPRRPTGGSGWPARAVRDGRCAIPGGGRHDRAGGCRSPEPGSADRFDPRLRSVRSAVPAHLAFGSAAAAEPTLGADELPGRAGDVLSAAAEPQAGTFAGTVDLSRDAAVLFKVSFDPRFSATVDGVEVPTEMLAPAFVGVRVPEGRHEVALSYEPFPFTGPLHRPGDPGDRRAVVHGVSRSSTGSNRSLAPDGDLDRRGARRRRRSRVGRRRAERPSTPIWRFGKGSPWSRPATHAVASEQYRAVLDARPGDEEANYRLGAIEHAAGRVASAERYCGRPSMPTPAPSRPCPTWRCSEHGLGATQEAIDLLERVVTAAPDDARAHLQPGPALPRCERDGSRGQPSGDRGGP